MVVELDQDVQVLRSEQDVHTDFARSVSPKLAKCLAYQLGKLEKVVGVRVTRVPFPSVGSVSAVYRAEIDVQTPKGKATFLSDYVFFGAGRMEYEFTVIAPMELRDQLTQFELGSGADRAAALGSDADLVIRRSLALALVAALVAAAAAVAADSTDPRCKIAKADQARARRLRASVHATSGRRGPAAPRSPCR